MNWGSNRATVYVLDDGLGVRRIETDAADGGTVEVLEVSPALAAHDSFEEAIRTRAAKVAAAGIEGLASVRRVERHGATLTVIADHIDGLRLPDFLQEAIKGNVPLPQAAALELAGRLLRTISLLHRAPGMSHGAITPSHVVITRGGDVVVTDAVFGPALEGLQRNREQLWREFRLALPASASLSRFDQRADVAQLGATVLAIALGRPLRANEYPRAINEAVIAATLAARPGETGTSTSALRNWLQQSLHLHPRATFSSAIEAERDWNEMLAPAAALRGGDAAFAHAVQGIFGDTAASAEAVEIAAAWSQPEIVHPAPSHVRPTQPLTGPDSRSGPEPAGNRPLSSFVRSLWKKVEARAPLTPRP